MKILVLQMSALTSRYTWSPKMFMARRFLLFLLVACFAFTNISFSSLAASPGAVEEISRFPTGQAQFALTAPQTASYELSSLPGVRVRPVASQAAFDAPPLCLPGNELLAADDCLQVGPAQVISEHAAKGWTYPPRPLPGRIPERSLSAVPFAYAHVRVDNAPVFASLDAAVAGSPVLRNLPLGFQYVTYIQTAEVDGRRFLMVDPGIWMRREDLSPIATGSYQGLEFYRTPSATVAWARNQVDVLRGPGYHSAKIPGRILYRYDIVQVYDTETVDGVDWYMIKPGEWVEGRQIGRVLINPTPPQGVTGDRWIEINLFEQTLAVYDNRQLVFASLIATGVPGFWTRPGLFQIYQKKEAETMQGSFTADRSDFYRLEDVPWTMYFDQARALHAAYWHNRFGYQVSHGCVNMSPGDANWLFSWAAEGDWVYVWDPSGETPTDPSLYGSGGA